MNDEKPKNNPEKELFRRRIIDGVIFSILLVILLIALAVVVDQAIRMTQAILLHMANPAMQPVRETIVAMLGAIAFGCFFFVLVKYSVYNDERVDQLKKIVEGEDKQGG